MKTFSELTRQRSKKQQLNYFTNKVALWVCTGGIRFGYGLQDRVNKILQKAERLHTPWFFAMEMLMKDEQLSEEFNKLGKSDAEDAKYMDPFGYKVRSGKLSRNAEEQKAVRLILDLSRKGKSLRGICRELEAAGIARKQGSRAWHPQVVSDILQRELKAA